MPFLWSTLFIFIGTINFSASAAEKPQFYIYPVLILDQPQKTAEKNLPPRFRVTPFHASGSGQFNKEQLIYAMRDIKQPIYIIDLRQESHGFINNAIPISWYGEHDWLNKGFNANKVKLTEENLLKKLYQQQHAAFVTRNKKINATYLKENKGLWGSAEDIPIKNISTEEMLVKSLGFNYQRIPITDHMAPTDTEVTDFLNFYQSLPPDAWLHFHCHGGAGRTTTFLVMTDILKNGQNTSLKNILSREQNLGGSNLLNINSSRPKWYVEAAHQRLVFLQKFYDYVHSGNYHKGESWKNYVA